jgi:predicted TIM-barrel fold metal-dependent hydrolase
MADTPVLIVSTDGHASPPLEVVRHYLEARYHDALDEHLAALDRHRRRYGGMALPDPPPVVLAVIDRAGVIRGGGRSGGHDPARRLLEMDREGVVAEVVSVGAQSGVNPFCEADGPRRSPELHDAGARAWNRWMADVSATSGGRLVGVALPGSCVDLDSTLRQVREAARQGFRAIFVPGQFVAEGVAPLYDPSFEPLWAECAALGLTLYVHAGYGMREGQALELAAELERIGSGERVSFGSGMVEEAMTALDLAGRMVPFQLMLGGVFDAHPQLRLVLAEMRADWAPALVAHLDRRFDRGDLPLKRRPSEYWREHVFLNVSSIHAAEVQTRHEIGVEQMMFGTDFPHPEGTWPNTHDWIRAAFAGVPEDEARAILGENALRCFDLDAAAMAAIAERIGPSPGDLFGEHAVDARLVAHFDSRAGYRKPVPAHRAERVDRAIDEHLAGLRLLAGGAGASTSA